MLERPRAWPMSRLDACLRVLFGVLGVALLAAAALALGADPGEWDRWFSAAGFGGYFLCASVAHGPWPGRGGAPRAVGHLTPGSATYGAGRDRAEARWEQVTDVKAGRDPYVTGGPQRAHITVTVRDGAGARVVRVAADPLAMDPLVAYWTLRHYAAHPEARAELADGRAAERIGRRELTG